MNREEHLQEISNTLIEVTFMFHQDSTNIVTELHNNLLVITARTGEKMREIREEESKEKTHEST